VGGVRLERHDGYWLLIGPAAPGATATTLWSVILMRPRGVGDARLLRHELEHVRQWRRYGVIGFLWRYLGAYLCWRARGYRHQPAYRRIPFEIEAEWRARRAPIEAGASEADAEVIGTGGELAGR
jgi:Domain of unknown function (DUF4157)